MRHLILLAAVLCLQIRTPETLRDRATPPPEGKGQFRDYAYTFKQQAHDYLVEFTPALPARDAVVIEAMKSVCRDLYDLDFTKSQANRGPGPDEWGFELKDLRVCYGRRVRDAGKTDQTKSIHVWMP
jgi:hypothetical protein